MRISAGAVLLATALTALTAACGGGGLFRQYEYEEELYLSLDGSATLYVNSSIAALNALRGTAFDADPSVRVDLEAARAYYTTPVTRVSRATASRRSNRRYLHLRIEIDDVRRLSEAAPFAWSSYRLGRRGAGDEEVVVFAQQVGASAGRPLQGTGLTGDELTAFRVHVPSEIVYHNAGPENLRRGNILVWEQPLADRLRGAPLTLEARMEPRSILYRTLLLFAATMAAVAVTFAVLLWWVVRRKPPLRGNTRAA
jgi:hypothetical protein